MITLMCAGLIYGIYLVVPGWLAVSLIEHTRNRFLLSYAVSLMILTGTLVPVLLLNYSPLQWLILLHVVILFFALASIYRWKSSESSFANKTLAKKLASPHCMGTLILLGGFSIYHLIVGPFTEVPSDFWKHLARVNNIFLNLDPIATWQASGAKPLTGQENPIYLTHAIIAQILGVKPLDLILPATWAIGTIFLLGFLFFTYELLGDFALGRNARVSGGVGAALITVLAFGTATFSYVRYYGYFPAIFSFPLVLTSVAVLTDYLKQDKPLSLWQWSLIPLLLLTMWMTHRQEAYFAVLLLTIMVILSGIQSYRTPIQYKSRKLATRKSILWITVAVCILSSALILLTREITPWKHTPHVVDAGVYLPFLKGMPLDNPTFRLWDTIGFFGLTTLFWALYRWKTVSQSNFLLAGIFIILTTNLNPFYAEIFLRIDMPSTLWRTAYLFPVGIMAAVLVTTVFFSRNHNRIGRKTAVDIMFALLLIVSLLPWSSHEYYNRTSRLASLSSVDHASGAYLWQDLIEAVYHIQDERPIRRILTDSTTRFILYSATRGEIRHWTDREYFPAHRKDYETDFLLSDYTNTLLVINHRNGIKTNSARHAGHWPSDILLVSKMYPDDLVEFIHQHPHLFDLLWTSGDINVYLMHPRTDNH